MIVISNKQPIIRSTWMSLMSLLLFFEISCNNNPKQPSSDSDFEYIEEILFISSKEDPQSLKISYDVLASRPDGTDLHKVIQNDLDYFYAVFSPSKRYIAASVLSDDISKNIIQILSHDGNILYELSDNSFGPVWSPDETEMLFIRFSQVTPWTTNVFRINLDGTDERQLTESVSTAVSPLDWNSEDKIVVNEIHTWYDSTGKFNADRGNLLLYTSDWESNQVLTDGEAAAPHARFSPDGQKLAYVYGNYLNKQIMVMDFKSGEVDTLVRTKGEYKSVVWSPIGDKIAYTKVNFIGDFGQSEFGSEVFIFDILNESVMKLTNSGSDLVYNLVLDWR